MFRRPLGFLLGPALLLDEVILYLGFLMPDLGNRFSIPFSNPTALAVGAQEILGACLHLLMAVGAVSMIVGSRKLILMSTVVVVADWLNSFSSDLLTHQDAQTIWFDTMASLILVSPLVYLLASSPFPKAPKLFRWAQIAEAVVAVLILGSSVYTAIGFCVNVLTSDEGLARVSPTFKTSDLAMPVETLDGEKTHVWQPGDGVTLVNFWASWCAPCRRELPQLEILQKKLGSHGVKIVLVNVDLARADDVRRILAKSGVSIPCLLDLDGRLYERLGFEGLPTTVLVNAKGDPVQTYLGEAIEEMEHDVRLLEMNQNETGS